MARILLGRNLAAGTDSVTAHQASPPWLVREVSNLVPYAWDYADYAYTNGLLTSVVMRSGGASGTIVATLTLAYTDGHLSSIART